MLLILKIPIVYLCVVIWWAIKEEPAPPEPAVLVPVDDTPPGGRPHRPRRAGRRWPPRPHSRPRPGQRRATSRAGGPPMSRVDAQGEPPHRRSTRRRPDGGGVDRAVVHRDGVRADPRARRSAGADGGDGDHPGARRGADERTFESLALKATFFARVAWVVGMTLAVHHRESADLRRGGSPRRDGTTLPMGATNPNGLNAGYVAQLLEEYLDAPGSVPVEWRELFERDPARRRRSRSPGCRALLTRDGETENGPSRAPRPRRPPPVRSARGPGRRRRPSRPATAVPAPVAAAPGAGVGAAGRSADGAGRRRNAGRREPARRGRRRDGAGQGLPDARPSRRAASTHSARSRWVTRRSTSRGSSRR